MLLLLYDLSCDLKWPQLNLLQLWVEVVGRKSILPPTSHHAIINKLAKKGRWQVTMLLIVYSHNLRGCFSEGNLFISVLAGEAKLSSSRKKIIMSTFVLKHLQCTYICIRRIEFTNIWSEVLNLHTYVSEGLGMQERPTFTWAVSAVPVKVSNAWKKNTFYSSPTLEPTRLKCWTGTANTWAVFAVSVKVSKAWKGQINFFFIWDDQDKTKEIFKKS